MMTTPWTTWVLDIQWHIWQSPKTKTPCLFGLVHLGAWGIDGLVGALFCQCSNRLIQGDQRDRVQDLQPPLAFSPHWTAMATSLWVFLNNNDSILIITFRIITILFIKLPFLILWSHWLRAPSTQTSQASAPPGALDEVWLPQVLCYNYHDNQIIRSIINQINRSSDQLSIR